MDDINIFSQNEKDLETLIPNIRIYSQNIGMGYDIKKCAIVSFCTKTNDVSLFVSQVSTMAGATLIWFMDRIDRTMSVL